MTEEASDRPGEIPLPKAYAGELARMNGSADGLSMAPLVLEHSARQLADAAYLLAKATGEEKPVIKNRSRLNERELQQAVPDAKPLFGVTGIAQGPGDVFEALAQKNGIAVKRVSGTNFDFALEGASAEQLMDLAGKANALNHDIGQWVDTHLGNHKARVLRSQIRIEKLKELFDQPGVAETCKEILQGVTGSREALALMHSALKESVVIADKINAEAAHAIDSGEKWTSKLPPKANGHANGAGASTPLADPAVNPQISL